MKGFSTEVVIAGAGLAGSALAHLLSRSGIECTVVDPGGEKDHENSKFSDPRALSITPASARILSSLNVWQQIPTEYTGRFSRIHVWDENSSGELCFDSAEICEPVLGYIVQQSLLQDSLTQAFTYNPNIRRLTEKRAVAISIFERNIMLKLDDGTEIKAELLVGADGVNSGIRELNGMAVSRHDYHQTAVACIVKTALDHENIARQRFLGSGPLAFLPMADPRSCGIVWSTGSEYAGELLELEDKEFARRLQSAFESRLGEITDCRPRARFSLFRVNAVNYIKERCVLVGDAAHSIHPMAGLGANMGLLDVAALAELIMEAKRDNRDIGSRKILRKYERWRKYENSRLMAVLEVIKLLFEQDNTAMNNLRSTGMNTINSTPFIKNPIMRHAMGLAGDMPALVRRTLIQGLN